MALTTSFFQAWAGPARLRTGPGALAHLPPYWAPERSEGSGTYVVVLPPRLMIQIGAGSPGVSRGAAACSAGMGS
jgi:hypothetical protein